MAPPFAPTPAPHPTTIRSSGFQLDQGLARGCVERPQYCVYLLGHAFLAVVVSSQQRRPADTGTQTSDWSAQLLT